MTQPLIFKLSICIGTFNRAAFIGSTLDSIVTQVNSNCEIVVLDNASTDNTKAVVLGYAQRFNHLRYSRQDANVGLDRNYDSVVELARGEYCWLMSDDDLLKPGAVAHVLKLLAQDPSLVVVNAEIRNFSMSEVLQGSVLNFESDRVYGPEEMDRLFVEAGEFLKYIGAVVVKRSVWLARERERYYGSLYIHVGVIFQEQLPGRTLVIAEPLLSYRTGNGSFFSVSAHEIVFYKWPSLLESSCLSSSARKTVSSAEPWRHPASLLLFRGLGYYSLPEYRRWISPRLNSIREKLAPIIVALLPGVLANALSILYYSGPWRANRDVWRPEVMRYLLRQSPLYLRNWRVMG